MNIKIYQIDAFADKVFAGNPAAVCPLDKWLSTETMQQIAHENNLSETVFFVKHEEHFQIRWFTPSVEVELCGHATLAAAWVLYHYLNYKENTIRFYSPYSGILTVSRYGDFLTLDFPADTTQAVELTEEFLQCFSKQPREVFKGKTDYLLVFDNEQQIRELIPRLQQIACIPARGIIVTAKGDKEDFVSRFFAPQSGINEDPVTGSAHTTLAPFWAERLGKTDLTARQLSQRQGYLQCRVTGDRVEISGQCVPYMTGELCIRYNDRSDN